MNMAAKRTMIIMLVAIVATQAWANVILPVELGPQLLDCQPSPELTTAETVSCTEDCDAEGWCVRESHSFYSLLLIHCPTPRSPCALCTVLYCTAHTGTDGSYVLHV